MYIVKQKRSTEWLKQKYEIENWSISKIARECEVAYATARRWFVENGYTVGKRPRYPRCKKLSDESWLRKQYLDNKLSFAQVGELSGYQGKHSISAVRKALVRFNIPIRPKGEGLKLWNLSQGTDDHFIFNKSVIIGGLLGDASMRTINPESDDSQPCFSRCNVNYDHVLYVARLLFSKGADDRVSFTPPSEKQINDPRFKNSQGSFGFRTLTHSVLLPIYREWYPAWKDHKKTVPKNIEVDSTVLLHWFMDDGYSYMAKHHGYDQLRIYFSTQSFNLEELTILSAKVKDTFGLAMYPRFHQRKGIVAGTGYEMELSTCPEQVQKFFEIIGPCPVDSLAYKWKTPDFNRKRQRTSHLPK